MRTIGVLLTRPCMLTMLADTCGMAGQYDEALTHLTEAANIVKTSKDSWAEAELYRLRGRVLTALGDHVAAAQSFQQALATAQSQSVKLWELRATIDLTRLWRDQGKRSEAHDLLAPVYGWFTEGFDTPVLKQAKALLEQLSA